MPVGQPRRNYSHIETGHEEMKAHQERMVAIMKAGLEETEFVAEHQEVPKEKTAVETIRALEDQYRDWHLAIGCCLQLKKWTQGSEGSQKKLATTRMMTYPHSYKRPTAKKRRQKKQTKEYVIQGAHKGGIFQKRRRAQLKSSNSIRDRGLKQELCLGSRNRCIRPANRLMSRGL
jgi:hypothetical protein